MHPLQFNKTGTTAVQRPTIRLWCLLAAFIVLQAAIPRVTGVKIHNSLLPPAFGRSGVTPEAHHVIVHVRSGGGWEVGGVQGVDGELALPLPLHSFPKAGAPLVHLRRRGGGEGGREGREGEVFLGWCRVLESLGGG